MRALVVLMMATGIGMLVMFFWREQLKGRIEETPPLVAQLERLVSEGALGGATPESLVATLVFSEPYKEADPWDLTPRKKGGMSSMFGEPRETAFLAALGREPRTAGWRMADASSTDEAEAQMAAALAWAAQKGARLRVIAHGAALAPVLRAMLAAPAAEPPVVERVLGVGVRLADIKAREPELAAALDGRAPAGQWFNLFSEASVVPRELALERIEPGAPPVLQELAWPGSSWVPTVVGLSQRGAPQSAPAMPSAAPGSQMSVRQFRNAKEGSSFQRVVDGKGHLVSGSLLIPKLDKEEIPPDPEALENKAGDPAAAAPTTSFGALEIGTTGWKLARRPFFAPSAPKKSFTCEKGATLVSVEAFTIGANCFTVKEGAPNVGGSCPGGRGVKVVQKGRPAYVCVGLGGPEASMQIDEFAIPDGRNAILVRYTYPKGRRADRLDQFMETIEGLEPPAKK